MDLDVKKMLLEELMKEMDDSVISQLKGKKAEPVAIVKEEKTEAVPASELKDKLKEVMGKAEMPEVEVEGEDECEDPEMSDEEDLGAETSFLQKLQELKKAKKFKE